MERFQRGEPFVTGRGEINIRFELAMAMEAQGKTASALKVYEDLSHTAPTDSYYEMSVRYEIARLNLKLWLRDRTEPHLQYLNAAASAWEFWLSRDWMKQSDKMWGYYHSTCLHKELLAVAEKNGQPTNEQKRAYDQHAAKFLYLARDQKGVKRYEVRFTAFFLESADYEGFPGEPLQCGLGGLLKEFQLR